MAVRILILGTDWTTVRVVGPLEFLERAADDPDRIGLPAICCWARNSLHLWPPPDETVTKIEIDFNGGAEESAD